MMATVTVTLGGGREVTVVADTIPEALAIIIADVGRAGWVAIDGSRPRRPRVASVPVLGVAS